MNATERALVAAHETMGTEPVTQCYAKATWLRWRVGIPPFTSEFCHCFKFFGEQVNDVGPAGSGQAARIVNQVMVAGIAETVCEALSLAE